MLLGRHHQHHAAALVGPQLAVVRACVRVDEIARDESTAARDQAARHDVALLRAAVMVRRKTGSGRHMTLWQVAGELSRRLIRLFMPDESGRRPINGDDERYRADPNWKDLLLFHEYFHGESGMGLGANHQTGWTGLVAKLLQQSGE